MLDEWPNFVNKKNCRTRLPSASVHLIFWADGRSYSGHTNGRCRWCPWCLTPRLKDMCLKDPFRQTSKINAKSAHKDENYATMTFKYTTYNINLAIYSYFLFFKGLTLPSPSPPRGGGSKNRKKNGEKSCGLFTTWFLDTPEYLTSCPDYWTRCPDFRIS